MTQKEINELFGVPQSTLKDWKADPEHRRHNLAIYLASLDYQKAKKEVENLKKKVWH